MTNRYFALTVLLLSFISAEAQNFTSTFLAYNNLYMNKTDLDQDGDLDIITGGLNCVSWEENKGNNVFVNHVISQSQPEVQWVVGADLDGDGYQDIVTASLSNNAVYWLRNLGNQTFAQTTLATATGGTSSVAVADLDNDGDMDVAGTGFNGDRVFWLRNNGAEVFTQIELLAAFDGALNIETGDLDDDGDADIMAAAREGGRINWFRNNGGGSFTSNTIINNFANPREVKLRDYDQDGDLDVIYVAEAGSGWFSNTNGNFTINAYTTSSNAFSVDVADIDGDGLLDFIRAFPQTPSISWSRNTGNQVLSGGGTIDNGLTSPSLVVPGDFNADGKVDVMCGSDFDVRLAINATGQVFSSVVLNRYATNNHGACHGDFDNDGDIDLMETAFTFMYWYRNEGNGDFTPIRLTDNGFQFINNNYGINIETVDMDGDGDDDAVYNENDNNKVSWIENRGNGLFSYRFAFSIEGPYCIDPVDFDNDGDIDVVCGSTANDAVYWFENNGSQTFTQRFVNGEYFDPFSILAEDIDNDGDMDIFTAQGNPTNKLILHRNSGNNSTFTASQIDASAPNISSIDLKDVDGDGDLDLLSATGGNEDRISWYRNSGGSFPTFTEFTVSTGVDGATYVFGGDYDGDGDMDVVSASQTDKTISLFKNDGSQSFTRIILAEDIDGADFVESGDLDGDGLEEIYATGSTHGIVQVFKNTPYTPPPPVTLQPCADLFISEVVEGSSWNKGIEIYNPTQNDIELSQYRIQIYANGSTQPTQTLAPNGTVVAGDVYAFVHILADLDFWFEGDLDGQYNFNGNDAITLTKNGDIIDIFGVIGQDPGVNGWLGTNGAQTTDRTIVRKASITKGNNINGPTFDASTEWEVYPIDAYQYFGNHTGICATACVPTVAISTTNLNICAGASVTFTATITNGGDTPVYQWKKNGNNVGTNSASFTASNLVDNDVITCTLVSNATCAIPGIFTSNQLVMNVSSAVTPTISISTPSTTICTGSNATFTATITNGGSSPLYQWKKNGTNVGLSLSTYIATGLVSGDVITCVLTSNANCVSNSTATSNSLTMSVVSSLNPSVSIAASSTTICAGTSVTFTATPTNGGASPSYQWKVNGNNVGTNSATYTTTTLANGNIVTCVLTSNASCLSTTTATSNAITITVSSAVTPTISISTPSTTVCGSASATFTANITNGGISPVYQWKKNGSNVGTNASTYTASGWSTGDQITCTLTSNASCASGTVTSNTITLTITNPVTPTSSITASNTNICSGTSVLFSAFGSNQGPAPGIVWKINGNTVATSGGTYSTSTLQNGDVVNVTITSSLACVSPSTVTSNSITMTVNPSVTPTISITASNTNICSGQSVTFTAATTNGGTTPSYQWKRNGSNVGSNASTYSTTALSNGDIITCVLTGSLPCGNTPLTSNGITMSVSTTASPSISISTATTSVCSGQSVSFTANTSNGGSNPVLNWKVNGNTIFTGPSPFVTSALVDNDVVSCTMVSNAPCVTTTTANSNNITMDVSPSVTPAISISTNNTDICVGQLVTFTATPSNGGTFPGYQWKKNGSNVGTNSATYTGSSWANGDVVTCTMSSNAACASSSSATSNAVTLTVNQTGDPIVSISTANTSICAGDEIVFTSNVSSGGSNPNYAWLINGGNTNGNAETFATTTLNDGDVVTLFVSGSSACIGAATSQGITINVLNIPTPQIVENAGALETEPIVGATYNWYLNGGPLAGQNTSVLIPESSGSFTVEAELNGCTSEVSAPFDLIITSVKHQRAETWNLIPNPAANMFEIKSSETIEIIELFDVNGRLIQTSNLKQMWIQDLSNGIYFVRVNQQRVEKLVIQH